MKKVIWIFFLFVSTAYSQSVYVKVQWQANVEADLAGYKLYFGQESGMYGAVVDVGNVTGFIVPDLLDSTHYYFALTAYDTARNESGFSDEASVYTVFSETVPADSILPAIPVWGDSLLLRLDFSPDSLNRIDINDVWKYHELWKKHLGKKVRETIP